jgi:eukaryotic-like serine/threonine-protein kinase
MVTAMAADDSVPPDDPGDDARERQALRAPTADKLARAVARSRIAGKLFAKHEAVKVGRYHLLEQVGAGGMGVVWGAWDPELERRVAVKVVKPELTSARERIVREGQALAKISHPHVVPVYDVGVVDDQVYLVMEWVRGETLRAWIARPRAVRDVVRAYREAALGLAAVHAAGLVHRDFKPENAMLGADGRVRVLDFGLAHEGGGAGIAGTPRYMAPEQRRGEPATAAVDQYALGVALREALATAPPKWLAAIVTRATADDPGERFASMQAVADALDDDPARRIHRRIAVVGALGLAGTAFAIGMRAGDDVAERCVGGSAEIAAVWDAAARERTTAHLERLGPYGAQLADRTGRVLDDYARRWSMTHAGACKAHDRGELTDALYTANLACLTRAKIALTTARDVLAGATRERLPETLVAIQSLPGVERCPTEAVTTAPPPAAIASRVAANANAVARARVLALAIDPRAIETAAAAARAADELGDARQIGRASLVHGLALLLQQQRAGAITAFTHATRAALEANDVATAIEALARQLYALATTNVPGASADATIASLELALPIAKGLVGDDTFARALFYNNLGTLHLARADRVTARRWFEEAEHVRPSAAHERFELAAIHGNLGLVERDRTRRDALLDREGDELEAALGADHPMTLDARLKAGMFVEHAARSAEILRDACGRYREMHPHLVEKITQCAYEVAWLAEERGDASEVADALAAVVEPGPEATIAAGYRDLLAGDHAAAARAMTEAAATLSAGSFWARWRAVDAYFVAALAADKLGQRAVAISSAERALAALDGLGELAATSFVQRRHGRLLAWLALAGAGDVPARTEAALAWAQLAGGYDARIAALSGGSR